jgi:DNA (cytosine-5)-methyltransferase 1
MQPMVIDLFCGCGGLSSGFEQAGFQVLAGLDKNAIALGTYKKNFPASKALHVDLSEFDPARLVRTFRLGRGMLDCLIGGPPCQGFSKNVPAARRFLEDPRNLLMKIFLEFVERLLPKTVLIENVAEMMRAYNGAVKEEIVRRLTDIGYEVQSAVLNAAWFGVPQLRRRAFFVATRTKHAVTFPSRSHHAPDREPTLLDICVPYVRVKDAISDMVPLSAGEGTDPSEYGSKPSSTYQKLLRNGDKFVHDHVARRLSPIQLKRIQHLGPGEGIQHLPAHIRPASGYSGAYARLIADQPARTITRWVFHPGSGRFVHPSEDRVITIREAARLQGFPDSFSFSGSYIQKSHQVGESVPPLLAKRLAEQIRETLSKG